MVCGLPGYYPDDLIDVVLDDDGGTVSIAFDAGIERPVRLTADEAQALTRGAARAGRDARAGGDRRGALGAGQARTAGSAGAPSRTGRGPGGAGRPGARAGHRPARRWTSPGGSGCGTTPRPGTRSPSGRSTRCACWSPTGTPTWRPTATWPGAIRHFRIDRIEEVRVLDEPAQGSLWVDSDIPERIFHPDPAVPPVELSLTGGARWVAEYYPVETIAPLPEPQAGVRVTLHAGNDDWLTRLVLSLGGDAVVDQSAGGDRAGGPAGRAGAGRLRSRLTPAHGRAG